MVGILKVRLENHEEEAPMKSTLHAKGSRIGMLLAGILMAGTGWSPKAVAGNENTCPSGIVSVSPSVIPSGSAYTVQASGLRHNTQYTVVTSIVNCFGISCLDYDTTVTYFSDAQGNLQYIAYSNSTITNALYSIQFTRPQGKPGHWAMDACGM